MTAKPPPGLLLHGPVAMIGVGQGPIASGGTTMPVRPLDLAGRMSGMQQPRIFKLPVEAARRKAREILNQVPQGSFIPVVENWRQLPNGQIEFTMRHLPTPD
jgi:hypothetical protein